MTDKIANQPKTALTLLAGLAVLLSAGAARADESDTARLLSSTGKSWRATVEAQPAGRPGADLALAASYVVRLVGLTAEGGRTYVQLSVAPATWDGSPSTVDNPNTYLLWLSADDGRLDRVEKVHAGESGRLYLPAKTADLAGPGQRDLAEFFLPGWLRDKAVKSGSFRGMTVDADGSDGAILTAADRRVRMRWPDASAVLPSEMEVSRTGRAEPAVRIELSAIDTDAADAAVARARRLAERSGAALISTAEVAKAIGVSPTAVAAAAPEPDRTDWQFFTSRPRALRPLLADPREARVRFGVMRGRHADNLLDAAIGGDAVLAWRRLAPEEEVSVSARGLFTARLNLCESSFPLQNSDYYGGVAVGYRKGDHAVEGYLYHASSHLGDELLEDGERERIDYSRETLRLLYARDFGPLRLYAGPSINLRACPSDIAGKVTIQLGAEYQWRLWDLPMYAAIDVQSKQAHDWCPNIAGQYGIWLGDPDRQRMKQRVFIEAFTGHSNMGQFWDVYERTIAVGYALDF